MALRAFLEKIAEKRFEKSCLTLCASYAIFIGRSKMTDLGA